MAASSQVYLILGKEKFLKREFLKELSGSVFAGHPEARLNTREFSAADAELFQCLEFAQTIPFLAPKRLAILWDVESLTETQQETLMAALERLPTSSVLALISGESNAKKNPFVRSLSAVCRTTFCHTPFEKDLPAWVEARIRQLGKRIEKVAVTELLNREGKDLAILANAIEQLDLYAQGKNVISADEVTQLFGKTSEEDIFRLVDLILAEKVDEALRVFSGLFQGGTSGFEIVGALTSQLERLQRGARLLANGCPSKEVGTILGVHPFFQEKFMRQLEAGNPGAFQRTLERLLECDEALKTGRLSEKLALERFLLEFSVKPAV